MATSTHPSRPPPEGAVAPASGTVPAPNPDHRRRLLDAMAQSVATKGYAATTLTDLAALAHVSRRTFYEHFATKEDCLIALYEAASGQALGVLRGRVSGHVDWHAQVEEGLRAYFGELSRNPVLLRTLFVEILGLGAPGLAARRRVNRRIAGFIESVVNPQRPPHRPLSPALTTAIVGGIHELVLEAIEEDRADGLLALVEPAAGLVRAVIDRNAA